MVGNHRYLLDGEPVPGVTSIIKGGLPAPALIWWAGETVAKYVADNPDEVRQLAAVSRDALVHELARVPNRKRDAAGVRGTRVHELGEKVVHGIPVETETEEVRQYVETYARWLDRFDVHPIYTECMVAHREYRYAGKFDLVARLGSETWLLDLKTSRGVYGDTSLQVEAYSRAQFAVTPQGTTIDMPRVDRIGVVHITPDEAQLYPLGDDPDRDAAWAEFLAAKVIFDGEDRRRGLINLRRPLRLQDVR